MLNKRVSMAKWLTLYHTVMTSGAPVEKSRENIVGKKSCQPYQRQIASFEPKRSFLLQMLPIWTKPKYCCLLKVYCSLLNKRQYFYTFLLQESHLAHRLTCMACNLEDPRFKLLNILQVFQRSFLTVKSHKLVLSSLSVCN